eukprot:UN08002
MLMGSLHLPAFGFVSTRVLNCLKTKLLSTRISHDSFRFELLVPPPPDLRISVSGENLVYNPARNPRALTYPFNNSQYIPYEQFIKDILTCRISQSFCPDLYV